MSEDSSEDAHDNHQSLSKKERLYQMQKHDNRSNVGRWWQVVLTGFAIFLLSQFLAILLVEVFLGVLHPGADLASLLNDSAGAQFAYVLLAEGMVAALVFFIVRRRGLRLSQIGLGRLPKWKDLVYMAVGFLIFYILLIGITAAVSLFFPQINTDQTQDVGFTNLSGSLDHVLALVSLVILPPLGEEPLMRGYLYGGLRSRFNIKVAAIITSVLFGLAHLQFGNSAPLLWIAAIDTFILSLVLVYLREKSGALYAGIMLHGLNNLIAFGVHFHGTLF